MVCGSMASMVVDSCVFAAAHDDVAGQERADFGFCGKGAAGQGRVAGTKDDVVADGVSGFGAKLGFEGGTDIDFGKDSESLG